MNRKYSAPPNDMSWSRSKGNIGIAASNTGSLLSTPLGRPLGRNTKKPDEEESTRKRIRVACSRCRKRKIKCSGPIGGEDQPCLNCRNANSNTTCAFELAGSMKLEFARPRYQSQDYRYSLDVPLPTTSLYLQDQQQQHLSSGEPSTINPSSSYPGALRYNRETISSSYPSSSSATWNYGYAHSIPGYNYYQNPWSSPPQPSLPSSQESITYWSSSYDPGCNPYVDTGHRISDPISPLSSQLSSTVQPEATFPGMNSVACILAERPPRRQPPTLSSSLPTVFLDPTSNDREYWPKPYEVQAKIISPRHSIQDMSYPAKSLSTRSQAATEQHNCNSQEPAVNSMPLLTQSPIGPPVVLAPSLYDSTTYDQQHISERYSYGYSSPKAVNLLAPIGRYNSITSHNNYILLPHRTRSSQQEQLPCTTAYNDMPQPPNRIPVEGAGGGRSVERD